MGIVFNSTALGARLCKTFQICRFETRPGTRFSKVPVTFRARKAVWVCRVYIQDQCINEFKKDQMKLSINETKLTGL